MEAVWVLPSGTWKRDAASGVFSLLTSALGNATSPILTRHDVSSALTVSTLDTSDTAIFPPEFGFDPATGLRLNQIPDVKAPPWIGPYGAPPAKVETRPVRGLPQSSMPLRLQNQHVRRAEDDADRKLSMPPAGHYEFLSVPSATLSSSLLAIDPSKGLVYVWLDRSGRWVAMDQSDGGMLAQTIISRDDWRIEAAVDALTTRIFLPTDSGLACLVPDAIGLSFTVSYHGQSPAVGSPVQFGDRVWAPLKAANGAINFVGLNLSGTDLVKVELRDDTIESLGRVASPVATTSSIIWATDKGQLQLLKKISGEFEGSFVPWPKSIEPALRFGSPYLASDGRLWQVCLDKDAGSFMYVLLGRGGWETREAQPPRLPSGNFNFRFATKNTSAPWIEPEQGDDSATDSMIVPVVESVENRTVFGLKFKSTRGIEWVLGQTERTRVVLIVDDADRQTEFGALTVPNPLQVRLFVHDAHLWVYHADHPRLEGWALSRDHA